MWGGEGCFGVEHYCLCERDGGVAVAVDQVPVVNEVFFSFTILPYTSMKTRQNDIYFKSFQMDKYGFDLDKKKLLFLDFSLGCINKTRD